MTNLYTLEDYGINPSVFDGYEEAIWVLESFIRDKAYITDDRALRIFDGDEYSDEFSGNNIDRIMRDVLINISKYLIMTGELSDYSFIQNGDFISIATPEFCRIKSLENGHKIGKSFLDHSKRYLSLSDIFQK